MQEPGKQSIPGLGTTTPGKLTPSDLVILKRTPWSTEELNGVVRVQVKNPDASDDAIESALATALLANEEAGALRLEAVQEKFFFGWFTRTILRAVRVRQMEKGGLERQPHKSKEKGGKVR